MSIPKAPLLVVIDGPAGAGKSTVARAVARSLGASLLDTGAIYRALALAALRDGVGWGDEAALVAMAQDFPLEFRPAPREGEPQEVRLAGEVVTAAIRAPEISGGASEVSAVPGVRAALLGIQRAIAALSLGQGRPCVAEGRDMGTVVFPDASFKFFLTATEEARARRRHEELRSRGIESDLGAVRAQMRARDERDSSRATAPLVQAADAVYVDSSSLDEAQVIALLLARVGG